VSQERPIWRPNEIPLVEWEAMSREGQSRWWKAHQPPLPQKSHMKSAIKRYLRGIITKQEFCILVAKSAVREEIAEFVQGCPPELLAAVRECLAEYGPDDSTWPRIFCIRCYAPWLTAEQITEAERQEQAQMWDGVRLLKEYFG
jgi:hypothetical protein